MPQKLNLLITASPERVQAHLTAIKFIKEAIKQRVEIKTIFFYQDAVRIANSYNSLPSDEPQLTALWESIRNNSDIELQTCVAASFRRGVLDADEAQQKELADANIHPSFQMVGLGQLASAIADKQTNLIHFK